MGNPVTETHEEGLITMRVKQISVFLENKSGRLAAVMRVLGQRGVNIRALSIADTSDFGILRLIVSDPQTAYVTLKSEGFSASSTDVIAVEVPDKPGGLAGVLDAMEGSGVNIEYMYAFCTRRSDDALVILRMEEVDLAIEELQRHGFRVLHADEVYGI